MEMDFSGYKLVFSDNFNGDSLNTDVWKYRSLGPRRCGVVDKDMVSVSDGFLHIKGAFIDGKWHTGIVSLKKWYTRGYFEANLRCSRSLPGGPWSGFWLQTAHSYDPQISKGGIGGAEIDIMECWKEGWSDSFYFMSTVHCAGWKHRYYDDTRNIFSFAKMYLDDIADNFHTFGLEWDREKYTLYLDNQFIASTSWGDGVSEVPEEVIFSLDIPSEDHIEDKSHTCEFTVDWIRVWQKPEDIVADIVED